MLDVFSHNANARLTERELYLPVEAAAFILVHGLSGSGHDIVANTIRYQAPNCKSWQAKLELEKSRLALAGIDIEMNLISAASATDPEHRANERRPGSWFMGELGVTGDEQNQLDVLLSLLQSGAQVIAYMFAVDPVVRLKSIFEKCDQEKVALLERLIASRGCRTIEVTRPQRGGDVFVRTTDPADRMLRLVVDNT